MFALTEKGSVAIFNRKKGISPARHSLHQFLDDFRTIVDDKSLPQPKCFISYCWGAEGENQKELHRHLRGIRKHIETLGATVYLNIGP